MTRRLPITAAAIARPRRGAGGGRGVARAAFTIVELLVVIAIMIVLLGLTGAAISGARASQKRQATQLLISKLDTIVQQQYSTYASRSAPTTMLSGTNKSADRAAYLRRLASAEMPDSWEDVKAIVSNAAGVPLTPPQRVYAGVYQTVKPNSDYADAECLFMIVMQSGIADCLDCGELKSSDKGDTDGDGAFEFLDAWGNPIRYVLWPAALALPVGSEQFFSMTPPFTGGTPATGTGGTMRPLIFSGGPDGTNAIRVNGTGNLVAGARCGDPTGSDFGKAENSGAADNITNFDAEVKR